MEASGFTGPYPTEAAAEAHSELEGPAPGASEAEDAGGSERLDPPGVSTEGHSELEADSPAPAGGEAQSATAAPPVVAATVGQAIVGPANDTTGKVFPPPAGLGIGEAAAGYSTAIPALPDNEAPGYGGARINALAGLGQQLAGPASYADEQTSGSRTGALPNVAATPYHGPTKPPPGASAVEGVPSSQV